MAIQWVPVWNTSHHHKSDLAAAEGGGHTRRCIHERSCMCGVHTVSVTSEPEAGLENLSPVALL